MKQENIRKVESIQTKLDYTVEDMTSGIAQAKDMKDADLVGKLETIKKHAVEAKTYLSSRVEKKG